MHFLIDGHNLLFALGKLTPRTPRSGHESARRWLTQQTRAAHGRDAATIVFDGYPARPAEPGLFSHRATADDLIEARVATERMPARLTVVSDDRRLKDAARHRGCRWLGCLDYCERWLLERKPATPASPPAAEKPESGSVDEWAEAFGDIDEDPRFS